METQILDIAKLNDRFRGTCLDVFYTPGIRDGIMDLVGLSQAIESYNRFTKNNDPYGEHDFDGKRPRRNVWTETHYRCLFAMLER